MSPRSSAAQPVAAETLQRLRRLAHVALDMDGTIYRGGTLFPCTAPFLALLRRLGIGHSFLTTNPSKSVPDYLQHLAKMGLTATRDELYTSAMATIEHLRGRSPRCGGFSRSARRACSRSSAPRASSSPRKMPPMSPTRSSSAST